MHGDNCRFLHELKQTHVDENGDEIIYLENPRLYVNNLSWDVTWQDLKGLFRRVSEGKEHREDDDDDDDDNMLMRRVIMRRSR